MHENEYLVLVIFCFTSKKNEKKWWIKDDLVAVQAKLGWVSDWLIAIDENIHTYMIPCVIEWWCDTRGKWQGDSYPFGLVVVGNQSVWFWLIFFHSNCIGSAVAFRLADGLRCWVFEAEFFAEFVACASTREVSSFLVADVGGCLKADLNAELLGVEPRAERAAGFGLTADPAAELFVLLLRLADDLASVYSSVRSGC